MKGVEQTVAKSAEIAGSLGDCIVNFDGLPS
jgi:hypothetical protein